MAAIEKWLSEKPEAAEEQGRGEKPEFKSSSHQLLKHTELDTQWMKETLT